MQITQRLVIEEARLLITCAWQSGVKLHLECLIPPSPNVLALRWELTGWNENTRTGHDLPPLRFSLYRWADPKLEEFAERFAAEYQHEAFKSMCHPKVTPLPPPRLQQQGGLPWIEQACPPDPLFPHGFRWLMAPLAGAHRIVPLAPSALGEARLRILPPLGTTQGVLCVAVTTSSDRGGAREAMQRVRTSAGADPVDLWARCTNANQLSAAEFWSRSRLKVSDPLIEAVWHETLHARRCAYRADTVPPGLFLPSTVPDYSHWHGDYHLNYNFQEPFWGDYTANHPDLGDAYFQGMRFLLQIGRKIARDYYGCRGVFIQLSGYPWSVMQTLRGGRFIADRDFPVFRDMIRQWRHPNGLLWGMALANYGRAGAWTESLGVIAPLQEMMLQSWDGALRVFPAWPRSLEARYESFRAEGAFLVSAASAKGQINSLEILSEQGARCRLYTPWPDGARVLDGKGEPVICSTDGYGRLEFQTRAGEHYRAIQLRR